VAETRPHGFIAGLGVAQIVSWGTLYYAFPLIAGPMSAALGLTKVQVYGAASIGLASGGLAAFPLGRLIDAGHGRLVMTAGAAFGALMLLAWSQLASAAALLPLFVGLGLAQAASLYEPAFAVTARRFGADAREGITQLTLWGGFASTVFIPVTQALLSHLPWRDALLALSALQLGLAASLNWAVIRPARDAPRRAPATSSAIPPSVTRWALRQPTFWALLVAFTLYYGAFSALTLHLYPLLVERGLPVAAVVLVLALIGPAQVLGRVALWKGAAALPVRWIGLGTLAVLTAGLVVLRFAEASLGALVAFALIYGAANGVMTIVRGLAVPEMLSRESYGALNGLLATPAAIAKAVAPLAGAAIWSIAAGYALLLDVILGASALVLLSFGVAAWRADGRQAAVPSAGAV
jgi:hypothetical protein